MEANRSNLPGTFERKLMNKDVNFLYSFDCLQPASRSGLQVVLKRLDLAVLELSRRKIRKIHVEVLIQ
jgi:hypothetical protein